MEKTNENRKNLVEETRFKVDSGGRTSEQFRTLFRFYYSYDRVQVYHEITKFDKNHTERCEQYTSVDIFSNSP